MANSHTTTLYVKLATDPATAEQYKRPLHDIFFGADRAVTCLPGFQLAYDVALWLLGAHPTLT